MESERKVEWESGREGGKEEMFGTRQTRPVTDSRDLHRRGAQQRAWRDEEVLGGDRGISVMRVRRVCVLYRGTVLAAGSTLCFLLQRACLPIPCSWRQQERETESIYLLQCW